LTLYQQIAEPWSLQDPELGLMLGWAARLHEIGLMVSHSQYQKHGAYLLSQADLAGFTRPEQMLLAALVLGHRRKFPVQELDALPRELRQTTARLCVVLRLAVLLHRGRSPSSRPDPQVAVAGERLSLSFPDAWLDEHPLTRLELEQEAEQLDQAGIGLDFG
jgi:exopolyphosphatase/guanosine-5'-triphosphate,3'-diphosphate pyrophosphatase